MSRSSELSERLRRAYAALPEKDQARVKEAMRAAHDHTAGLLRNRSLAPADQGEHSEGMALAFASLFPDETDSAVAAAREAGETDEEVRTLPPVGSGGEIYGTGKYEQLDPGWLVAVAVWLENLFKVHPFNTNPAILTIPNTTTLALLADWGTGDYDPSPSPAVQIATFVSGTLKPDIAIHLGDVYYAGTAQEETDNFLAAWPFASGGNFALNSNHEMYDGANGYFGTLLADPHLRAQNQTSFFALQNDNWMIIALDTAYYADKWKLYLAGNLASSAAGAQQQLAFLTQMATQAQAQNKRVMVLSHQNGLPIGGGTPESLWSQVLGAFPSGTAPDYWYWGHEHVGAVYANVGTTAARCTGHSAIPWGFASVLQNPKVRWFEQAPMPGQAPKVMNGFVGIALDGSSLTETFYQQDGTVSWSASSS